MKPLKCNRCGFDGYVAEDVGHVCLSIIPTNDYEKLVNARGEVLESAANLCESLPRKYGIQPADRRSRMANLCAAEIRKLK